MIIETGHLIIIIILLVVLSTLKLEILKTILDIIIAEKERLTRK